MRVPLSTALLLTGLIAVCLGWVVDRQQWQAERAGLVESNLQRDVELFEGFSTFANISRSTDIFFEIDELEGERDASYLEVVDTQLVSDLLELFEYQYALKTCSQTQIYANFDSLLLSLDGLRGLDCKSTDQFFQIAKALKKFEDPSHFPELHDSESIEHKLLTEFVSDAIAILDQLFPGPSID